MSNDRYLVIEYTEASGGWAGNRYITGLGDESLDSLRERLGDRERVIAHDISMDEAQRLTAEVPIECKVASAFEEATVGGELQPFMLNMGLQNIAMAVGHDAMLLGKSTRVAQLQYAAAISAKVDEIEDPLKRIEVMRALAGDSF